VKSRSATIAAAVAAVFPLLAICTVSITHASPTTIAQRDGGLAQASVVGGQEAPPGSFPFMAFVVDFQKDESAIVCSGTVIAPRVVLTAAHCAFDEHKSALNDATGYRVVTGVVNWTSPERQMSEVSRMIPYPKWAPRTARDGFGDAALLVLATPTTAPSIALAKNSDTRFLRLGTHARIAGWGMTYAEQTEPTESLMWAKTLVESDRCEGLWGRICAIDFPKAKSGVCHGDSGGPLFVADRKRTWLEIGIVEAGFGTCTTKRPQIFTRTDLLGPWIKSRVQKIEAG
jgi:secreted trypsin-like serine protease